MSTNLVINGSTYPHPSQGEENWATQVINIATALSTSTLQKSGGSFTLTAEVNFGATYGLKTAYYKSQGTNPSSAGVIRLANAESIGWRNAANGADKLLTVNASDQLAYSGTFAVTTLAGAVTGDVTGNLTGNVTGNVTGNLTGDVTGNVTGNLTGNASTVTTNANLTGPVTSVGNATAIADGAIALAKLATTTAGYFPVGAVTTGIPTYVAMSGDAALSSTGALTLATVPIDKGGTGQTTAQNARNALLPTQTGKSGQFLKTDGTDASWAAGGAGSGEKNYITNPSGTSDTNGWSNVGDLDINRTTTAAELPRENTTPTGLKITADSNTQSVADYVYFDFTLDDVDVSKTLAIKWAQKVTGTYTAGQLAVGITTQADRTTFLHTPVVTDIPAYDGDFLTSFTTSTTATLSLVIRATGDMTTDGGIVISDVVVGPSAIVQSSAAGGPWTSWTPTGSWSSNTTYTGKYRRVGTDMQFDVKVLVSGGAPTSAQLNINLPTGYTIDTSALTASANGLSSISGTGVAADSLTTPYKLHLAYGSANTLFKVYYQSNASGAMSPVTQAAPFTFGDTDYVHVQGSVPIAEWAGSGFVGLGEEEYAYNSDVTNANTTASGFAYGPDGVQFGNFSASNKTKRVRFLTPIQPTDLVDLQVFYNREWTSVGNSFFASTSTTTGMGLLSVTGSTTDTDVIFGSAGFGGTVHGGGAGAWSVVDADANYKWRVVKYKKGAPNGFALATSSNPGLAPKQTPQTALTFSSTPAGWSLVRGVGIAYSDSNGIWRLKFNVAATMTAGTNGSFTIDGVTAKTGYIQAVSVSASGGFSLAQTTSGSGAITVTFEVNNTAVRVSGDIELDSKPSWA